MSQLKNIKLNTPTFKEIIPSNKQEVSITPFKVGDEKVLLMAAESKDNIAMINSLKRVVNNCTHGVELQELASFDLEYLFLKIRAISVGETAKILLTCPECNTANNITVELSEVQVKGIDSFENNVKINDELYFNMKLPELEDYADIDVNDPDTIINFIASNVLKVFYGEESIDVGKNDIKDVVNIIEQLTSQQFEFLKNYVLNIPKVSHDVDFKCSHCDNQTNIVLEGLADFF